MITYKTNIDGTIDVLLDGKLAGTIRVVSGDGVGFQYFPKGQKEGGAVYPELSMLKRILEAV
jgi:hypothetical protein